MAKNADQYLVIDPWRIIEEGYSPERSRVSESLFSLANEHLGVRGYFDEHYTGDSLIGCYLNSIYEEHFLKEPVTYKGISNRICFMVNTVNWLSTSIEIDGETLDLNTSLFSDFRRELSFQTGELRRSFTWQTRSGKTLKLEFSRFLSMDTKELAFQQIALTPIDFSGPVSLTLGMDFSIIHECYKENFWECPQKTAQNDMYAILGCSTNIKHKVFAGFSILADNSGSKEYIEHDQFVGCRFSLDLIQGQTQHVQKLNVIYTSRDPDRSTSDTWSQGMDLLNQLQGKHYQSSLQDNARYWKTIWDTFDITIEGDPETQQGIRYCIFQLQQTCRGIIDGANIGAKGLTGEAYNGNAFWDTETYCLPYYIFSNPGAARALIDFRYKTLPQAMERAKQLDCDGACFPIATSDGTESCTLWQHASLQFQPTTSVAYAIWHYTKITQDWDFLDTKGAELLIHICRFLASRGQWSPRRNKFGYYAVMGPDEFQVMVNNNCYTNFMARQTFLYACQVLTEMGSRCPDKKAALCEALVCYPSEISHWQMLADNMIIPYDPETKLYEQHEGFFDLPHIDVDAIPVEDFPLYHHWSYDRIYRNDMIKQPDVLMFMLLYNQSFSLAEKQANYDYYEPRCIHESSLSPSVHSILAAELGRYQEAFEFFKFATRIDLDNYNRNTAEGIHMTSIAAAWMNIVYGFGGMRSDGDMLIFNPSIPSHWKSYSFKILYRNSLIQVSVDQKKVHIQLMRGEPINISIHDQVREIGQDGLTIGS
jgi:maltose phosphorylase